MQKASSDRPINILTWEDRHPARYDDKPLDLSKLKTCSDSEKSSEMKNGKAASNAKS